MKTIITLLLIAVSFSGFGQSLVGKWKTIDDTSGKEKSIVEIFERQGKVYGKIIKIFPDPGEDPDPLCNKCPEDDARYKKKIIGMEIIQHMVAAGKEWVDGKILDPEAGKIYTCKLWLEGNSLKVRGYWGPFYRTQTWVKSN